MRYVLISLVVVCSLSAASKREQELERQVQIRIQENAALSNKLLRQIQQLTVENHSLSEQLAVARAKLDATKTQVDHGVNLSSENNALLGSMTRLLAQVETHNEAGRRMQTEMLVAMYALTLASGIVFFFWLKRERLERWASNLSMRRNMKETLDAANHNNEKFHDQNAAIADQNTANNDKFRDQNTAIGKIQHMQQDTLDLVNAQQIRGAGRGK